MRQRFVCAHDRFAVQTRKRGRDEDLVHGVRAVWALTTNAEGYCPDCDAARLARRREGRMSPTQDPCECQTLLQRSSLSVTHQPQVPRTRPAEQPADPVSGLECRRGAPARVSRYSRIVTAAIPCSSPSRPARPPPIVLEHPRERRHGASVSRPSDCIPRLRRSSSSKRSRSVSLASGSTSQIRHPATGSSHQSVAATGSPWSAPRSSPEPRASGRARRARPTRAQSRAPHATCSLGMRPVG